MGVAMTTGLAVAFVLILIAVVAECVAERRRRPRQVAFWRRAYLVVALGSTVGLSAGLVVQSGLVGG